MAVDLSAGVHCGRHCVPQPHIGCARVLPQLGLWPQQNFTGFLNPFLINNLQAFLEPASGFYRQSPNVHSHVGVLQEIPFGTPPQFGRGCGGHGLFACLPKLDSLISRILHFQDVPTDLEARYFVGPLGKCLWLVTKLLNV